jgi:hypothetical protein
MTSLIIDPAWDEEDFDRLEAFIKHLELPNPTFTILTPLPGTELWEATKSKLVTDDYSLFDIMHLVLPSKLGPKRFYERFAGLYTLTDIRSKLSWRAVWNLIKLGLRGHGRVVRRIFSAGREMRDPQTYLNYLGTKPNLHFLPEDFGSIESVDRARSHLVERVAVDF